MKKQIATYPLRLPRSLKSAVADICKEEGTSINQFVNTAVAEKISAMKTAGFFTAHGSSANSDAARRLLKREGGQPPEPDDRLEREKSRRRVSPSEAFKRSFGLEHGVELPARQSYGNTPVTLDEKTET